MGHKLQDFHKRKHQTGDSCPSPILFKTHWDIRIVCRRFEVLKYMLHEIIIYYMHLYTVIYPKSKYSWCIWIFGERGTPTCIQEEVSDRSLQCRRSLQWYHNFGTWNLNLLTPGRCLCCCFKYSIFYFHPYLGKMNQFWLFFQMGWNHQLVTFLKFDMKDIWKIDMASFGNYLFQGGYLTVAWKGARIMELLLWYVFSSHIQDTGIDTSCRYTTGYVCL